VGNDVVDLDDPANRGKSGDVRFLARVFTAAERELIARSAAPDSLLWALWAAKEAAYKAVSGGNLPVCSIPRRYPVRLDDEPAGADFAAVGGDELTGQVGTPCGAVALRITVTGDYVHAVAAKPNAAIAGIIRRVDRMDEVGDPGDASAFVRQRLAAEISRHLGCPLDDLTVRMDPSGSGAPYVFLRDRPLAAEVSLSHDGRFAAFALLLRERSTVLI